MIPILKIRKSMICLLFTLMMAGITQAQAPNPVTLQDAVGIYPEKKEKCGHTAMMELRRLTDPGFQARRQEIERHTHDYIRNPANRTGGVLTVPIVFHVVYANAQQNVTDAQIQSQIDVLNKDFRRQNTDAGNTPAAFSSLAVDTEIEFCLATRDPQGNATTGITRTSTSTAQIGNGAYYSTAQGGKDGWDPNSYLNIWVCEISSFGDILGFAWPPGTTSPQEDGVVIDYRFFGTIGVSAPFNGGRTTTHEVGHYLNLEHVWGPYGGCGDDDGVTDTPG
ncbi:MAG: M43 family zinc metalloprotease, partial [Bacteroidota bacterium]